MASPANATSNPSCHDPQVGWATTMATRAVTKPSDTRHRASRSISVIGGSPGAGQPTFSGIHLIRHCYQIDATRRHVTPAAVVTRALRKFRDHDVLAGPWSVPLWV